MYNKNLPYPTLLKWNTEWNEYFFFRIHWKFHFIRSLQSFKHYLLIYNTQFTWLIKILFNFTSFFDFNLKILFFLLFMTNINVLYNVCIRHPFEIFFSTFFFVIDETRIHHKIWLNCILCTKNRQRPTKIL